jgi:hypothetical protein
LAASEEEEVEEAGLSGAAAVPSSVMMDCKAASMECCKADISMVSFPECNDVEDGDGAIKEAG